MVSKKAIGKYITEYQIEHNMSVEQFAQMIGASRSSVYAWKAGQPMLNVYYLKLLQILEPYFDNENQ